MLALHTTNRPDLFHLWSTTDRRYLMRSATEQRIREHVRVNAIEQADALMDEMIDNAETIKELH